MATLERHTLTPRPEEHARLAFRPDCPHCRELRLRGPLPSPEVVPRRAKAGLLAGMLAASGAAPAAPALAQLPPSNTERGTAVLPPGGVEADHAGRTGDPPAVELGGAPAQAGPPVSGPRPEPRPPTAPVPQPLDPERASDETPEPSEAPPPEAHVEEPRQAPATEPPRQEDDAPTAVPPDSASKQPPRQAPESGSEAEQQRNAHRSQGKPRERPPEREQAPTPEPPATQPGPAPGPEQGRPEPQDEGPRPPEGESEGESEQAAPRGEGKPRSEAGREFDWLGGSEADEGHRPASAGSAPSRPEPGPSERDGVDAGGGRERPDASVSAPREREGRAKTEPVHVVRPGESLWAIAQGRLGVRASDAAIAREVNRLWELNDTEVIRTGDPDLILPGQRLRL